MKEILQEQELCQGHEESKAKLENSQAVQPAKIKVEFKTRKKRKEVLFHS